MHVRSAKRVGGVKTKTYILPSRWACYLINGDASGDDNCDIALADEFLEAEGLGAPVSCEEAGFRHHHDARHYGVLPCDCHEYTFLIGE